MAVHVLDPNWDVMLTVRSPTKPFAPWVPEESNGPPPQPSGAPSQYRAAQDSPFFLEFIKNDPALQLQPLPVLDSEVGLGDAKAWLSIRMVSQPEVASVERESTRASAPSSRTPCGSPLPPGEHMSTSFGLSSRQLELASSHFRAIFQGLEQEKMQIEDHDVKPTMLSKDWDVEATLIVMQVIHGQSAKVPVDVELLAKTAVLVDFLGCHETFKSVSARWFANMKEVPQVYCRDLVLWIVASRIFSEREIFSAVTKSAVVSCKSPLQPLGLPFPQPLIRKRAIRCTFVQN
ncbi:hypothetical protein CI238_10888 [Colletotrichum incanum]|uniref:BTB domain-containing protein n=1 Tax=Colletotrichum incanum TaxID=1573173 RepID=A0A162NB56_COLIC|nr:hypothetical protein CI238_10888 [Colletotrichum incanum]